MQCFDRFLNINNNRNTRQAVTNKFKFTPSPDLKRLESDNSEVLRDFLSKTKEKFLSPQHARLDPIESRLEFFDNFKKVSSSERRLNLEKSSKIAYLKEISKNNLNPKPFGMIKSKDSQKGIDIHMYSMGDNYASSFAKGLKHFKNLELLNLRSNRLSDKGSYAIMSTLDIQPIRYLSLCDNILGEKSLKCLFGLLSSPKQCLKHLNLENTRLSTNDIISLASIVSTNKSLTYLSLAKNNIHSLSSKSLKEMLHYNENLRKLDLHWNCLKLEGAVNIFEGLQDNSSLRELDLSWNALGNCKDPEKTSYLGKLLGKQASLLHLDLSNNYMNLVECEIIGQALVENHRVLVHMNGNECVVDSRGFIVPGADVNRIKSQHLSKNSPDDRASSAGIKSNCWVCEKWLQVTFQFKENVNGPVFIHLECDDFVPEMMIGKEDFFETLRVVPPGKIRFFFSSLGTPVKANNYQLEALGSMLELDAKYSESLTIPLKVVYLHTISNPMSTVKKIDEFQSILRDPPLKYSSPKVDLIRIPWHFPTSIFSSYDVPSTFDFEDCFEFDWKLSKLTNLVKVPLHQTQLFEYLQSIYPWIFRCYKHLSSQSESDLPSIGINILTEALQTWNTFDNLYKISDLGVNWSACIVPKEKNQLYNPGNSLVRYEFLEILVRISVDRFVRNRICSNAVDAARKFFSETFLPNSSEYERSENWRKNVYFCEEVDLVYKVHKDILEAVFKKYSGRKTLPGAKNFMSIEEFREFCRDAHVGEGTLVVRDVDLAFVQAMMVQVDEVYKKRHVEMTFVEFIEAFARCCEAAGPARKVVISEKDQIRRLSGIYSKATLAEVIEGYMPALLKLCPNGLRENFVFPTSETYKKLMYKERE
jgi:Ran GTPase-activating protein (RanGAP) involved in mRNA processing and transport